MQRVLITGGAGFIGQKPVHASHDVASGAYQAWIDTNGYRIAV